MRERVCFTYTTSIIIRMFPKGLQDTNYGVLLASAENDNGLNSTTPR